MMSLARRLVFAAFLMIAAWPAFGAEPLVLGDATVPPIATKTVLPITTKSPPHSVKPFEWPTLKPGKWSGDWSGFYVGGELGGGWQSTTFQDPSVAGTLMGCCILIATMGSNAAVPNSSAGSFLGGVDIGWNYQIGRFVLGSDFDFTKTSLNSTSVGSIQAGAPGGGTVASENFNIHTDWTATATVTSGIAWDRWLGYAKAGIAWAQDTYGLGFNGVFNCFCGPVGPFGFQANGSELRTGWTVGVGLAWAFSDRLSAKLEYDYLYFGATPVDFSGVINAAGTPFVPATFGTNNSQQISQVKFGVNYKFASLTDAPTQRTIYDVVTPRHDDGGISGYDWSGFYIGGHAGGVAERTGFQDPSATGVIANCCVLVTNMAPGLSAPGVFGFSWLGGANAGWNYQIGQLVFGTNVELSETNMNTTNVGSIPAATPASASAATESFSNHTDWTATATASFGVAEGSRLWYTKAGIAWAHDNYSLNVGGPNIPAGPPVVPAPGPYSFQAQNSDIRTGLTVGTGLAWAISDSWIAKIEYDFLYFPGKEVDFTAPAANNVVGALIGAAQVTTPITFNTNSSQYISELKLGLDYKFTPGGFGATNSALAATGFGRAPGPLLMGHDWSGFYVGGHIGGGLETAALQDPSLSSLLSACCYFITGGEFMPNAAIPDSSGKAFLGGVQAGWDYQVGRFVIGGGLDFSLTNLSVQGAGVSQTTPSAPTGAAESLTARTDWTSSATATLGLAAFDGLLWYNKFGIAVAHTSYGYNLAGNDTIGGPFGFQAGNEAINVGWTVGTGVALALDANWSATLEYDYLDFGSQSVDFSGPSGNIGGVTSPFTSNTTFKQQISELKLGLNYKLPPAFVTQ